MHYATYRGLTPAHSLTPNNSQRADDFHTQCAMWTTFSTIKKIYLVNYTNFIVLRQ